MSLFAGQERRQARVGAIVLVVLLAAVAFVVFLADKIEVTSQVRFTVAFHHAGPLHAGAPVVVAGQVVGEVESIRPAPRGGVTAHVRVEADKAWMIDANGEFFVSSRGPLSERFLEVGPQPCERRPETRPRECTDASVVPHRDIRAGDEVRGVDPPSMDRVLQRTWDNLQTTRRFVESVRPELEALLANIDTLRATIDGVQTVPGEWARLFSEAGAMLVAFDETRALLGGSDGVDAMRATVAEGRAVAAHAETKLDTVLARWTELRAGLDALSARMSTQGGAASVKLGEAIDRARAAMAKLEPLREKIQAIRDRLARGEGSIGKLMKDPEFPEDAKELGKILKRQPWKIIGHPPDDLDAGGAAP
jgi:hypothetical protein